VQKGNPKGLHTLDDLTKGVRAASYTGTAYQIASPRPVPPAARERPLSTR
jgi:hypothetical protein